jgi:hypothetical protein
MPSTPFRVRPFSRSLGQHETNYHNFFLLFFVFYALESLLFFSRHSLSRDLFILLSSIGMHQVDPFVRPFIALAHSHALCCFSKVFPSYFFPFLAR